MATGRQGATGSDGRRAGGRRALRRALTALLGRGGRSGTAAGGSRQASAQGSPDGPGAPRVPVPVSHRRPYPGDYRGPLVTEYSPALDGDADPGEVVWTWVPYEEDHSRGKDRPVLVVGRDGEWLLGLMLTSRDHSRDAADEARWGRRWLDIGSGPWDRQGRPSEVRLDRVIRLDPGAVRREGAIMPRASFDAVVARAGRRS